MFNQFLKIRWFDKSISLIVCKDGTASVSFEHSWGDGVAVLRYFNEIYNDSIQKPFVHPSTKPCDSNIEQVVQRVGMLFKIYGFIRDF